MLTRVWFSSGQDNNLNAIDHPKSELIPFSSPYCSGKLYLVKFLYCITG